jgi:hypothetical protein
VSGQCRETVVDLSVCSVNEQCKSGLCEGTSISEKVCRPAAGLPNGHACNENADCLAVSYCTGDLLSSGNCAAKLANLSPCSSDGACVSGICQSTGTLKKHCRPQAGFPFNFECNSDDDCIPSQDYCEKGFCSHKLADLADCKDNDACISGDCETTGLVEQRQCKPASGFPDGNRCNDDDDCKKVLWKKTETEPKKKLKRALLCCLDVLLRLRRLHF